jgi:hypothetical protein
VRPRWGKFHRRPPAAPDEPLRVADEIFGSLAADLELVGFSLAVKDGGEAQAAGRKGRKIALALGSARPQLLHTEDGKKWRNAITVQALEGELVLDAETGAVLTGRLATRLSFQRGGRAFEMVLESSHAIDKIGGAVTVTPPPDAESVTTPLRSHEFEERQELLEGIAPPAAKAPLPKEAKDREGKER